VLAHPTEVPMSYHCVNNNVSFLMQINNGCHAAIRLHVRVNVKNVVKINNWKLFVDRGFRDRSYRTR